MKPLVSIVMPVYNSEKHLKMALNSLKLQTYVNFEVICVDDGSTDNSKNIIKKFVTHDNRFKYLYQENQFAGIARNTGLENANGKYIMFLDSDDIFEKNMLSYLVKCAEKNRTDIVFFGFYHFKTNIKNRSLMGIPYVDKNVTSSIDHKDDLFQIGQGVPWNRLYNTNFVRNTSLKFQSLQSNNDVFFSKSILIYADRMIFLNKRFVNYRVDNKESLQGSYKLSSGNFAKCMKAIKEELVKANKFDYYKLSFEKYVLENFLLIFNKSKDIDAFRTICYIEQEYLKKLDISVNDKVLDNITLISFYQEIINGNLDDAMFLLYKYMRENYVKSSSIENRIGKKILSLFKIKAYDI